LFLKARIKNPRQHSGGLGTDYKSAPAFWWLGHGLQIRASILVVRARITNPRQHSGG